MAETDQRQECSPNSIENGPQFPPSVEESNGRSSRKRGGPKKATGPRTGQGKSRSRLNALKHGLLSKFVLLDGESAEDYRALLRGLRECFKPIGAAEFAEVENMAVLMWRRCRFTKAEAAEISRDSSFAGDKSRTKQLYDAGILITGEIVSGGLSVHTDNRFVLAEIVDLLKKSRSLISRDQFIDIKPIIDKLFGSTECVGAPTSFNELFGKLVELANRAKIAEPEAMTKLKETMIELIDIQIEQFSEMKDRQEHCDMASALFERLAAVIPSREGLDRLLRYESQVSRELDRSLNRYERLQRMRKGQTPPPRLDINIS